MQTKNIDIQNGQSNCLFPRIFDNNSTVYLIQIPFQLYEIQNIS